MTTTSVTEQQKILKFFAHITKLLNLVGLWHQRQPPAVDFAHKIILFIHVGLAVTMMTLEFCFILRTYTTKSVECFRAIGTLAFHLICFVRLMMFRTILPGMEKVFEIVNRQSVHAENLYILDKGKYTIKDKFEMLKKRSAVMSFSSFYLFLIFSQASLMLSYMSALVFPRYRYNEFSNSTASEREMPYDHCRVLGSIKFGFYLEMFLQFYLISFLATVFLSKS